MVAVSGHQREPRVRRDGHVRNTGLGRTHRDGVDLRHGSALNAEDRYRALVAVRHQGEPSVARDRQTGRTGPGLQSSQQLGRIRLEVDHGQAIVRNETRRIGGVDFRGRRHEQQPLVRGERHRGRRTDHAGGHFDVAQHAGRAGGEIDQRDAIGRSVGHHRRHAFAQHELVVVGGRGELRPCTDAHAEPGNGRHAPHPAREAGSNRARHGVRPLRSDRPLPCRHRCTS